MNLTKKITLALGLLAASTSFAQDVEPTTNGFLGQRFAEFSFDFIEFDSISSLSNQAGIRLHQPLTRSIDVGASYSYARYRGPLKGHTNAVNTYAVGYLALEGVKPFAGASLGYSWTSLPGGFSDNLAGWSIVVGAEIPAGSLTVTPSITHSDDFRNGFGDGDVWTYRLEGSAWLTRRTAVYAAVALVDFHRDPSDAYTYELGLRLRY